jgi:hypothetical protein
VSDISAREPLEHVSRRHAPDLSSVEMDHAERRAPGAGGAGHIADSDDRQLVWHPDAVLIAGVQ